MRTENRKLIDLVSVGPATVEDLRALGITSVGALVSEDPRDLYDRLCALRGQRLDPCCEDVFRAAVAQARDPKLPADQRRWWYWSRLRKGEDPRARQG
ncbi:MAG: hypothetical protein GXP62_16465 [Oligoflexia bacterium]|nr:hypothetical protein [Oligoflexia bacterium]